MMGRTHFQVGILSYVLASTVPHIANLPVIGGGRGEINIAAACIAGAAALMADVDSQHSKINQMNPVVGSANKLVDTGEDILKRLLSIIFTLGIGSGILFFRSDIIKMLWYFDKIKPYAEGITYGAAAFFLILGVCGREGTRVLTKLPLIGNIYTGITTGINKGSALLKRMMMIIIYGGAGLWIIGYNASHGKDPYLYLVGALFIAAVIFPHRSFFHSIEGFLIFTAAVSYLSNRIGYPEFRYAFMIGYISHLYFTDIFTKEGVPLSVLPRILEKIGLHKRLRKFKLYSLLHQVLSIRLRVPLISTGTKLGNIFEKGYVLTLLVTSIVSFVIFDGSIKLI
ncbi:metal-dependent hydrolase [Geosporobacter ferrireducens]|uniref:metal-dependent hydrolase n=1 Tax=Geosporobacter ferrireducens TaxID=1424294 RepID=UPI00139EC2BE|nr:metal-dependent hydrolase [Geosporobacter ferrireducens]MTI53771.1 metal-dependent hydrolase [Geosporobacter ferrireducens]